MINKDPLLLLATIVANFKGQIYSIDNYNNLSPSEQEISLFYNEKYELITEIKDRYHYKTYKELTGCEAYLVRRISVCDKCGSKYCNPDSCEYFPQWEKDRSDIGFVFHLPTDNIVLLKANHSKLHTDAGYKKIESVKDFINSYDYYKNMLDSYLIDTNPNEIKITTKHLKKALRTYELLHILKEKFYNIDASELYEKLILYHDDSIIKLSQNPKNKEIKFKAMI